MSELNANSVDPDQTPRSSASELGLHCLPMSLLWDARLKRVGETYPKTILSKPRNTIDLIAKSEINNLASDDRTTKWHVRPTKTQISMGIRPVLAESSLCAEWVAKGLSFLHADSEDSDQTGRMFHWSHVLL